MNPAAWVERHARRRPDDPALAEGDRVHASWGEFATRTAGAATSLRDDFGLSPGDRVAIVMRNRPEYLEALYAIWHAGLVAVPVNARLHRDEIAYILEHSESAVAMTDADHAGDVESLVGTVASLKAAVVAPGERWDRLTASPPAQLADGRPEDPAWLFYTSGTTGRPKGATLTHRSLLMATLSYFADIEPVLYERIFRFVRDLELAYGEREPAFQYIVTTTTPPPAELGQPPFVRLMLDARDEAGLLLGVRL